MMKSRLDSGPNVIARPQRGSRKLTYVLEISTAKDLKSLIDFLYSNISLQGYKYVQYINWKKNTLKN
jgi:predicted adenine nucleotide alpha hydrolase (AANH) superfamily ATPase